MSHLCLAGIVAFRYRQLCQYMMVPETHVQSLGSPLDAAWPNGYTDTLIVVVHRSPSSEPALGDECHAQKPTRLAHGSTNVVHCGLDGS